MKNYIENRPWGQFEILKQFMVDESGNKDVCVKIITVKPRVRLSYQSHNFRHEYWTIVQGHGYAVLNGRKRKVKAGDKLVIPAKTKHRIMNEDERRKLTFVEVSLGHFDEDDIVRYQDDFGRVKRV